MSLMEKYEPLNIETLKRDVREFDFLYSSGSPNPEGGSVKP